VQKLYRSRSEKVLAGVCGGLGEYFNVDPVFVRILFVVAFFSGGLGLIAYIVFWIATPERPIQIPSSQNTSETYSDIESSDLQDESAISFKTKAILGYSLIAIGFLIILGELIPNFDFEYIFSLILISSGLFLLFANKKRVSNEQ